MDNWDNNNEHREPNFVMVGDCSPKTETDYSPEPEPVQKPLYDQPQSEYAGQTGYTYYQQTPPDPFESSIILKIDENMRKSQTVKYVLQEENEHIESCTGTLSASGLEVSFALMSSLDPMKYSIENSGKISGPGFFFIKDSYGYSFPKDINCLDVDCKKYSMKYDSISIFSDIPKEIEIYLEPYDDTIILKKSI